MMDAGIPLPNNWHRISYFHCSLFGYFLGLLTATISSEVINYRVRRMFVEKLLLPVNWELPRNNWAARQL